MRAPLWIVAALVACVVAKSDEKKVVCYFGSWAVYREGNGKIQISDIDPTLCTHLVYAFVGITTQAEIRIIDAWADLPHGGGKDGYNLFNQLRSISPSTKTLIAIGGWNEGSKNFSVVAASPELRKKFAANAASFTRKYGFDGFDLDWEYPNQRGGDEADKENFILLLREMRKIFDDVGILLTAAVAGSSASAIKSYNISEISKYFDLINIMAYDFHGAWDKKTGIHAPLYPGSWEEDEERMLNVNDSINFWLSQGAPREKLIVGLPTYGRTFTLKDSQENKIGAPTIANGTAGPYTKEPGMIGYNEICEKQLKEKWNTYFQEEQRVPYTVKDDQWIGYENVKSIGEKAELIKSLDLGGAMIWSVETDDFKGVCGTKYPLLKTLNHILRGGPPLPPQEPECKAADYIRDSYDCSIFYNRIPSEEGGFIKYKLQCPNDLYFDLRTNSCRKPKEVDCESKSH